MDEDYLILKRASASRPSGDWNDDDYDVVANGAVVGRIFGRPLKLTKHQIQEAIARREAGETLAEIGRSYNVSHSTISRL